jgi:hypothetical protein
VIPPCSPRRLRSIAGVPAAPSNTSLRTMRR